MGQIKFIDSDNTLQVLGVAQNDFNLSFVIDGTKDSAKIEVVSFAINEEIKPNTILYHEDTDSWWIVSNDKVEYYINEQGYLYKHILKLQGLIELLNARDLTDCGFFANNYTIREFIFRLFELSNMNNFGLDFDTTNYEFDLDTNVDYTKSFENYTLLSALREFLDGYNVSAKARLVESTVFAGHYNTFELIFISKTGNGSPISEDVFNNVKQTRTIDKNSYGVSVISNAENVISTKAKTFPSIGTVKLSANSNIINRDSALLRLPSNIYKVNWLQMVTVVEVFYYPEYSTSSLHVTLLIDDYEYIKEKIQELADMVAADPLWGSYAQEIIENIDDLTKKSQLIMRTTLYTGWTFNPINNNFIQPKDNDNFYFPQVLVSKLFQTSPVYDGKLFIGTKEDHDSLEYPIGCIYYERGKNIIENFQFMGGVTNEYSSTLKNGLSTDFREKDTHIYNHSGVFSIFVQMQEPNENNSTFRVNYIPMSDLKIEYDNAGIGEDIQLYNQNGKLTDSVALSKLLLSYSKEIESDNITRFGAFTNYNNVPKVGNIVEIDNQDYVINNVSLNFFANEDKGTTNGYYIVGEFTLSKKIAVKSLMTNPNTNIRDYGIPQNMNVKRKQLYRDFYELSHSVDTSADTDWYLPLTNLFNLSMTQKDYEEHICVMKITYDENIGGDSANNIASSQNWYYQLDTTTYIMKKAIYEIVDFKDNNIIGYGNQNIFSGFNISRLIYGQYDNINTPISYVDYNGKFKGINFSFCTVAQVQEIYDDYKTYHNFTRDISLYNYSCFIDKEIFEGVSGQFSGARTKNDFRVNESEYDKDPIEVPIFEYSCQIDDSEDVIVGENIFSVGEENEFYLYAMILVDKDTINEYNFKSLINRIEMPTQTYESDNSLRVGLSSATNNKVVEFSFIDDDTKLRLTYKMSCSFNANTGSSNGYSPINSPITSYENKDIVVYKHVCKIKDIGLPDLDYGTRNMAFPFSGYSYFVIDYTNKIISINLTELGGYFYVGFNEPVANLTPFVNFLSGWDSDNDREDILTSSITNVTITTQQHSGGADYNDYVINIYLDSNVNLNPYQTFNVEWDVMRYAAKQKYADITQELMFIIKDNNDLTSLVSVDLAINHYKTN